MKTFTLFTLSFILLFSNNLFAQSTGNRRVVPFQITFVPPIGTNGTMAGNTVNKISLNIIAGYASGLEGVEFGSFANINRDYVAGVQFAGFANITKGEVSGAQFAGFANSNANKTDAAQFAGFTNRNRRATSGFQFAGFGNLIKEKSTVIQVAGFGNGSEEITGAQIAGFGNSAQGNAAGIQIAGFGNFASNMKGGQIAGFGNFTGNVNGAQIAGFINVAKTVDGIQLGVLNIADTVKNGIPIGVLSVVKNGYREFEIGMSEGLNSYASFKIGVKQFYNIFSVGMQFLGDRFRWGFGYGLGTHLADSKNVKVNLEAMTYHINEDARWTNVYNDLQQIKLTFAHSIGENVSLFAGPTINLMISDYYKKNSPRTGSDIAPYHYVNKWSGNTNLKGWIGFTAGLRIN